MVILTLFMLLAPGLIALRRLWSKKDIRREDYKFIICDYIIYSFLIHLVAYAFLFFTNPDRTVSFATEVGAISHILSAGFVFKYSFVSLVAALFLPALVPWLIKTWSGLEENRAKRIRDKK
jgi:hypothetical protein